LGHGRSADLDEHAKRPEHRRAEGGNGLVLVCHALRSAHDVGLARVVPVAVEEHARARRCQQGSSRLGHELPQRPRVFGCGHDFYREKLKSRTQMSRPPIRPFSVVSKSQFQKQKELEEERNRVRLHREVV